MNLNWLCLLLHFYVDGWNKWEGSQKPHHKEYDFIHAIAYYMLILSYLFFIRLRIMSQCLMSASALSRYHGKKSVVSTIAILSDFPRARESFVSTMRGEHRS